MTTIFLAIAKAAATDDDRFFVPLALILTPALVFLACYVYGGGVS